MKIEFQYFDGCPHAGEARKRLVEAVERIVPGTEIHETRIQSVEQARRMNFPDSPTSLINGIDLEGRRDDSGGMACRLHPGGGAPPEWMIEAGLLRTLRPNLNQP